MDFFELSAGDCVLIIETGDIATVDHVNIQGGYLLASVDDEAPQEFWPNEVRYIECPED